MLDLVLRLAKRRPHVRLQTVRLEELTPELTRELHAMSNRLATEDLAHFEVHAKSNDVVHVFRRRDTDEIVGFQFWRTMPIDLPRSRVVAGGKLRMDPEFRNRGLHLLSGLVFYLSERVRHPRTRLYRISVASVLGFISLTDTLASYTLLRPTATDRESVAVRDVFAALADESDFELRDDGLIFVDIFMTEETLGRYPAEFFERAAARVYRTANPDFRTNGCFLGFWFRFTPTNVLSLTRAVIRKIRRSTP
ncbi:hypothetical protein [Tenggerimyces flavus]|uniref:GNAT family N-acetyltransferase n=1 Tax=Tenggerimyces flavus TaxID=1708749 RepID=A0ABV7YFT0_9ACTN|nr:hypothetical protein [Tenggerimyces flavus]MBM7786114.1 hypothetical protein [Tenggerimyces flavus]